MLLQAVRYPRAEEIVLNHGNPAGILDGFKGLFLDVFERQFVVRLVAAPVGRTKVGRHRYKAGFGAARVCTAVTAHLPVQSALPGLVTAVTDDV